MRTSRRQDTLGDSAAVCTIILRVLAQNDDANRGISDEPAVVRGVGNAAQRMPVLGHHEFPPLAASRP